MKFFWSMLCFALYLSAPLLNRKIKIRPSGFYFFEKILFLCLASLKDFQQGGLLGSAKFRKIPQNLLFGNSKGLFPYKSMVFGDQKGK